MLYIWYFFQTGPCSLILNGYILRLFNNNQQITILQNSTTLPRFQIQDHLLVLRLLKATAILSRSSTAVVWQKHHPILTKSCDRNLWQWKNSKKLTSWDHLQKTETSENTTSLPFTANILLRARSTFTRSRSTILNHSALISNCRNIFIHLLPYLATLVAQA